MREYDQLLRELMKGHTAFIKYFKYILKTHSLSVQDFSAQSGIPKNTLYKILSGQRSDFRISTLTSIYHTLRELQIPEQKFIALITSRAVLDRLDTNHVELEDNSYALKEYPSITIEEVIQNSVLAERDGACGIVCGPIAATSIRNIVDIPVTAIHMDKQSIMTGLHSFVNKL